MTHAKVFLLMMLARVIDCKLRCPVIDERPEINQRRKWIISEICNSEKHRELSNADGNLLINTAQNDWIIFTLDVSIRPSTSPRVIVEESTLQLIVLSFF